MGSSSSSQAAGDDHAKAVSIDLPKYMVSGEQYPVRIEYKNAGDTTWTEKKGYRINWTDSTLSRNWGRLKLKSLFSSAVKPGDTAVIEFEITAPHQTGVYQLGWELLDPDGNPFGDPATVEGVRVESPNNQADVVLQLVPDQVSVGASFTAVIQVKNIGRTTWSRASGYHLATVEPNVWNIERLELDDAAHIAPDEVATFKVVLTAPNSTGEYPFEWQMRHKKTYFGQPTPLVNVRVGRKSLLRLDSEFVYQNVSKTMLAGETHEAVVQFKNTSQIDWHAGEVYLASPVTELTWAIDTVEMKPDQVIKPGEFIVFHFNVQAPIEPGVYPFEWQLRHRSAGFFGMPSEKLNIDVK